MRCNNCGWDNLASATLCIKCGTALESSQKENTQNAKDVNQFGKTITDSDASRLFEEGNRPIAKTTSEEEIASMKNAKAFNEDILIKCSNAGCGYLNPAEALSCAKCKSPLQTFAGSKDNYDETIPPKRNSNRQQFKKTIDPYRVNNDPPGFFLEILLRDNEKMQGLNDGYEGTTKHFSPESDIVILNRENLDKNNDSITGKQQAQIAQKNGKWYLKDNSDQQTTFIQAKTETELKEGDIILMGNRRFRFSMKNKEHWDWT